MTWYYFVQIMETQAFDVLLNTFFWIVLWAFMTIRLNRIEDKL